MKLSLLLLTVAGLLLMDKAKNSDGQLVPIYSAEDDPELDNDVPLEHKEGILSYDEIKEIYDKIKNISHSKGHITKSKEGDPEYRRSFIRKVIRETKFEALKLWFTKRINASGEYSVSDLQELEHLVHQYETGIDFAKLGGVVFLLPLTNHTDPEISSAALSVLTAAMQGNPTVKKYADEAHILHHILKTLTGIQRLSTTSLYTLSSFIRNNPVPQLKFFRQNGLDVLADILKSKNDSMKSKLKVLDLLHDLASEIFKGPVTAYESPYLLELLQREFEVGFFTSNLCLIIPKYLDYEDIVIQEKTIGVMNSVVENVCSWEFKRHEAVEIVEQLIHKYDDRQEYYFWVDSESDWRRMEVFGDLIDLFVAMTKGKDGDDNNFRRAL